MALRYEHEIQDELEENDEDNDPFDDIETDVHFILHKLLNDIEVNEKKEWLKLSNFTCDVMIKYRADCVELNEIFQKREKYISLEFQNISKNMFTIKTLD